MGHYALTTLFKAQLRRNGESRCHIIPLKTKAVIVIAAFQLRRLGSIDVKSDSVYHASQNPHFISSTRLNVSRDQGVGEWPCRDVEMERIGIRD